MPVKELTLDELVPNDYNPRNTFDTAAMEDLKESIDDVGLVQPLTVRKANENGTYEVISGERRLRALSDLNEGQECDTEVPCNVVDVDDSDARIIAITENIQREDLNPIEEAKAYAHAVEVDYGEDDETQSYMEYLKNDDVHLLDIEGRVRSPTKRHSSVQTVADNLSVGPSSVAKKIKLVILPDELQQRISNEDLLQRYGVIIAAKFSKVEDPDRRRQMMFDAANDPRADHTTRQSSRDAVREYTNTLLENYEQEKEEQQAEVEKWEQEVAEQETELQQAVSDAMQTYNSETDRGVSVTFEDGNDMDVPEMASEIIDALSDKTSELGGDRINQLDADQDDLQTEQNRLITNLETVKEENHSRCPFCKAGISVEDLQERIDRYDDRIESVKEEKRSVGDAREELRDAKSVVRGALNSYEDALDRLKRERERAAQGGGGDG